MTGVDLTRIDGVDGFTALKVLSEIGTDMTRWPSAKHFASWLGLSPNNRITGGKVKLPDQGQRQPGCCGIAAGGQRAASPGQRPRCLPAPEEGPVGISQGHHGHSAQAGQDHLLHAALRAGICGCRSPILRESVPSKGAPGRQAESRATRLPAGAGRRCS